MYNSDQLYGLDDRDIDFRSLSAPIHREVVAPFLRLQAKALAAGFALEIASGYRSFERQLAIWNAKLGGERPVLDLQGLPLDLAPLTPWQQVEAILRWSALPGTSRHHWGTDLDVYDGAAVEVDYRVQLSVQEVEPGGPFAAMHDWLDCMIERGEAEGFFRPYADDRGGVAPERWHLSYGPLAGLFESGVDRAQLARVLEGKPLRLKAVVLENLDEILRRFVAVAGR